MKFLNPIALVKSFFHRKVQYFFFKYEEINLSVTRSLEIEGIHRATQFIFKNCSNSLIFSKREDLWDFAIMELKSYPSESINLELGVANGYSINYFAKKLPNLTFHGFDSFVGLQENWIGTSLTKGTFDRQGTLPEVAKNVILKKGWFDETLPKFLGELNNPINFLHIDSDTYKSTNYILNLVSNCLSENCMILFDDFFGYSFWESGQAKAFIEWEKSGEFKYIALSNEEVLVIRN